MGKEHRYTLTLDWVGNRGTGTDTYRSYDRNYVISADGKPKIVGSSDPAFLGDPTRWNPEELLLASVAACHKLWYLHLCTTRSIVVTRYSDQPSGIMIEEPNGAGQFKKVTLHPTVEITAGDPDVAQQLHGEVGAMCFIARSVNFPIHHQATVALVET